MPSAGGYRKPALSDRRLNVSGKQLDGLRGKWKFLREDNEELNLRNWYKSGNKASPASIGTFLGAQKLQNTLDSSTKTLVIPDQPHYAAQSNRAAQTQRAEVPDASTIAPQGSRSHRSSRLAKTTTPVDPRQPPVRAPTRRLPSSVISDRKVASLLNSPHTRPGILLGPFSPLATRPADVPLSEWVPSKPVSTATLIRRRGMLASQVVLMVRPHTSLDFQLRLRATDKVLQLKEMIRKSDLRSANGVLLRLPVADQQLVISREDHDNEMTLMSNDNDYLSSYGVVRGQQFSMVVIDIGSGSVEVAKISPYHVSDPDDSSMKDDMDDDDGSELGPTIGDASSDDASGKGRPPSPCIIWQPPGGIREATNLPLALQVELDQLNKTGECVDLEAALNDYVLSKDDSSRGDGSGSADQSDGVRSRGRRRHGADSSDGANPMFPIIHDRPFGHKTRERKPMSQGPENATRPWYISVKEWEVAVQQSSISPVGAGAVGKLDSSRGSRRSQGAGAEQQQQAPAVPYVDTMKELYEKYSDAHASSVLIVGKHGCGKRTIVTKVKQLGYLHAKELLHGLECSRIMSDWGSEKGLVVCTDPPGGAMGGSDYGSSSLGRSTRGSMMGSPSMDSSTTNVTEYRKQHLEMLAKDFSKSITGVVLVVDINDRASFAEARDSLRVLAKTCNLSKGTVPVLVLANKVDLLPSGSDIGSMLMQLENDLDLNAEGIQGLKYAGCRDIAAAKGLHVREAYMSFSDLM